MKNTKIIVANGLKIHIDIEATSQCNLRCTMCARTKMIDRNEFWVEGRFPQEMFYKIIDECADKGLRSIKFQYLGEPLLNKKIHEMVKYCKNKGIIDVMYNTNAVALTEGVARKILDSGLDKIFFSFDSPYRDEYNQIRIDGDYDKVLKNIRNFIKMRNKLGLDKPVTRVSMIKLNESDGKYNDFVELFKDDVDGIASLDLMDHDLELKYIDERSMWNEVERKYDEIFSEDVSEKNNGKFCCPQLWQRMFVHPDGVVTPCCLDVTRSLKMGNVQENSVEEIWNGDKYKMLRKLHRTGNFESIEICKKCPLANVKVDPVVKAKSTRVFKISPVL
jgi:radical SAM protein with 4Fe4S-binding SPASM domain